MSENLREDLRRKIGGVVVDNFFRGLASISRHTPHARRALDSHRIVRDVPYHATAVERHRLDVYHPEPSDELAPIVIYFHGGGFRILSKETHWLMGLAFARRGYVVFNVDYRLAPSHPYPAAMEDCSDAFTWITQNAERFGGDASRIVLAGESAGANLALGVTLASVMEREEPWAQKVFDTGVVPLATIPACGMLQVSDSQRFSRRRNLPSWLQDRLDEVADAYLEGASGDLSLADPLLVLEALDAIPERGLPPMFAPVGTKDPLLDDTRRLKSAVERLGGTCEVIYYPGEVHAFHAFVWRKQARKCWKDHYEFLDGHT